MKRILLLSCDRTTSAISSPVENDAFEQGNDCLDFAVKRHSGSDFGFIRAAFEHGKPNEHNRFCLHTGSGAFKEGKIRGIGLRNGVLPETAVILQSLRIQ